MQPRQGQQPSGAVRALERRARNALRHRAWACLWAHAAARRMERRRSGAGALLRRITASAARRAAWERLRSSAALRRAARLREQRRRRLSVRAAVLLRRGDAVQRTRAFARWRRYASERRAAELRRAAQHVVFVMKATERLSSAAEGQLRWRAWSRLLQRATAAGRADAERQLIDEAARCAAAVAEGAARQRAEAEAAAEAAARHTALQERLAALQEEGNQGAEGGELERLRAELAARDSKLTEAERARERCAEAAAEAAQQMELTRRRGETTRLRTAEALRHRSDLAARRRRWQRWRDWHAARRFRRSLQRALAPAAAPQRRAWLALQLYAQCGPLRRARAAEGRLEELRTELGAERSELAGALSEARGLAEARELERERAARAAGELRAEAAAAEMRALAAGDHRSALAQAATRERELQVQCSTAAVELDRARRHNAAAVVEADVQRGRILALQHCLQLQIERNPPQPVPEETARLTKAHLSGIDEVVALCCTHSKAERALGADVDALRAECAALREELEWEQHTAGEFAERERIWAARLRVAGQDLPELQQCRARIEDLERERASKEGGGDEQATFRLLLAEREKLERCGIEADRREAQARQAWEEWSTLQQKCDALRSELTAEQKIAESLQRDIASRIHIQGDLQELQDLQRAEAPNVLGMGPLRSPRRADDARVRKTHSSSTGPYCSEERPAPSGSTVPVGS